MENQDNNKIDWNDDSGEIHTVYQNMKHHQKMDFKEIMRI